MFARYLVAEIMKLRRSLVLLLCVAAPSCVALLGGLVLLDRPPSDWTRYTIGSAALWSYAMLPLTVTALSVLLAQIEHGPRTWTHLLTLPGARRWLYGSKAIVMLALVAAMSALLWAMLHLVGWAVLAVRPAALAGAVHPGALAVLLARMAVASLLVCVLQLWVALRFRSFVPPLVFGLGGTLVAIGATSARQGIWFPWLLATNMLAQQPERQMQALWLGGAGGLLAMAAMLADLARREG